MTIDQWISSPANYAKAIRRIHDPFGVYAKRGDIGQVCDVDTANDYVIVDFPATGPMLCEADEIRPA
jgi:hypothetical protein